MNTPDDIDLIERYLLGKMSEAEKWSFELRMEDDRELARKCRMIKTFPEMMSEQGRMEYEKNWGDASIKVVRKKWYHFPKSRHLAWLAGSFIIITAIVFYIIISFPGQRNKTEVRKEKFMRAANNIKTVVPVKDTEQIQKRPQPENKQNLETPNNGVQKAFSLLTPAEGMKFSRKEDILFSWTQKTDTFARFYILSEFSDKVVFWRGIRPGIRKYTVPGSYLLPGKFYWYVGSKEERRTFIINN